MLVNPIFMNKHGQKWKLEKTRVKIRPETNKKKNIVIKSDTLN